jgi:hypothetical protein
MLFQFDYFQKKRERRGGWAILKREREGHVWPLAIFFCKQPKAAGGGGQLVGWQKAL